MGGLHIVLSFCTWRSFCDYCTSALKTATMRTANQVQQPLQLIICLGPLYGIGAGMLFAPTINYMSEWFDKKKSLAYGIMYVERYLCYDAIADMSEDAEWVGSLVQSFLQFSLSASKNSALERLLSDGPSVSSSLRAPARRVFGRGSLPARRSSHQHPTSASFASRCSGSCRSPRWFKGLLITSLASIFHPALWTSRCLLRKDL